MADLSSLDPAAIELLRRHNLLRALVEAEVAAEVLATVELSEEDEQQALESYKGERSEEEILEVVKEKWGWDAEAWKWNVLRPLRTQRWCEEYFAPKAEARFLQRKDDLDQVVYSLIRVKDHALAGELYHQVADDGVDFSDLAARYAEGPEKGTNGIVGPVPLTMGHPALSEKLRAAEPGALMPPFKLLDWWLLVRLERRIPANFTDEVADQMAQELFREWLQSEARLKLSQI
jgi:parvulin-like peptidyl-prolyl isomerase